MITYNYIFAGTGLSAFLVLHELEKAGILHDKKILLIDANTEKTNDRTWCFWEPKNGEWDFLVAKKWDSAIFKTNDFSIDCLESELQYKMIEPVTLFNYIKNELLTYPSIEWIQEKVIEIKQHSNNIDVHTSEHIYKGEYVINSIFDIQTITGLKKYPLLKQHFIGWFIKTDKPLFNPNEALFMDFSIPQKKTTRFMYVLPTSETEALFEFTLFSADLLSEFEYENGIKEYLSQQNITNYTITKKEKGVIPMSGFPLFKNNSKRVLNIGTAGGWTKGSTGYTFKKTQKCAKKLAVFISKNNALNFTKFHKKDRFFYYDLLFIDVLFKANYLGKTIFSNLFTKKNPTDILSFLDEETSLTTELKVMWACPKIPFIKALTKRLL